MHDEALTGRKGEWREGMQGKQGSKENKPKNKQKEGETTTR